jgi:O-succinylbenzoic acid--CoA ligase
MYLCKGKKYTKEQFISHARERINQLSQSGEATKWEFEMWSFILLWLDSSRNYFEVKTSGSTAEPKTILLKRHQMIASARATQNFFGLKVADKVFLALPPEFIAGKMMLVRALELGLDLFYFPPKVSVVAQIKQAFSFGALIPLQLQYAIDSNSINKLEMVDTLLVGGAAVPVSYLNVLKNIRSRIFASYGMTETITHVAIKDLKVSGSHYKALEGISFKTDRNQHLIIQSNRLPEKQTHTNDRVILISDKEFIFQGRADSVINSGGLKIHPGILEENIKNILAKEVFIGYEKDHKLGQKIVLVVEGSEESFSKDMILGKLKTELPRNQMPRKVLSISKFIRTANQKTDRAKMQQWIDKQ